MNNDKHITISWLAQRKIIGIIGLLHPVILYFGGLIIFQTPLQSSMSAYYYTGMRDVFVGLGFAIGVFLLAYNGYDRHDRVVSAIAGLAAIAVALFPAAPESNASHHAILIGYVHITLALAYLLSLSYFCLILFPKSDTAQPTRKKSLRNKIYRVTGFVIVSCLIFIGIYFLPTPLRPALKPMHPIFFAELISFWAFGTAWLVKGQAILADDSRGDAPSPLH